uniref:Uncharacterized protein n=1 Tax=Anopheles albimanus TaxID=7167 RepID=A0A182FWX2_ANOAL
MSGFSVSDPGDRLPQAGVKVSCQRVHILQTEPECKHSSFLIANQKKHLTWASQTNIKATQISRTPNSFTLSMAFVCWRCGLDRRMFVKRKTVVFRWLA